MKNILVPIDYSAATAHVVDLARTMAKAFGAEVHLIHVTELSSAAPPGTMDYGVLGMPELTPTSGLAVPMLEPMPEVAAPDEECNLKQWQKELAQSGVKVSVHEPNGEIVDEILKKADAVHADLIMMGRHGHGAMYNLLVGSATEGVLKRSTIPVLLVPSSPSRS